MPPPASVGTVRFLFPLLLALSGVAIAGGLLALAAGAGDGGLYAATAGLVGAAALCWARLAAWNARERQLERLTIGLEAAAAGATPRLPAIDRNELDPGLARLFRAAAALLARLSTPLPAPAGMDVRLAAVLGALPRPVLVVTGQGLVSLANQAAVESLGARAVRPGTSVFDAIDRASLGPLLAALADETVRETDLRLVGGGTRRARLRALPEHGGAVIALEGPAPTATGLAQALELHEPPPPRRPPRPDTALADLTAVVLDCESTGLNVGFDRLLSLAAVRLQGDRLLPGESIDLLVDPGEAIPAASTAIHGITDAMVMAEAPLAQRWPDIEPMLRDCVVIGHNVGFDLTLLETELRRAGIRWQRPPSLCTVQLAAALDPALTDLNLETVAQAYGIEIAGRHTALGDALATAEIYLHLLALMRAAGERTLADAQARAATATRVIREQQAAGW